MLNYIALYRKYRPNTFDEIVGQENITKILKNQVASQKISHAYIFSGGRGTGKTSAAKIFARAINCKNPKEGNPCNECEICKSILENNTTDVVEMDAASNNSVENIRQIRQEVIYATVDVKYRVYIIDEAHMLTTSAFNALLKTLEEPPENVVFILATTEQHKIPVTILSRCLRFEFNKIPIEDIKKRIEVVLKAENIEYDEEATEYISKLADGALRDALSILDRCLAQSNEKLNLENVQKIVGFIDKDIVQKIVDNIIIGDNVEAIKQIDIIIQKGKDLRELVFRLTEKFLDMLINNDESNIDLDNKMISDIIEILSKLDNDIRSTTQPSIVLKANIIKLCALTKNTNITNKVVNTDNIGKNIDSKLIEKVSLLETQVEKLTQKLDSLENISTENTSVDGEKTVKSTKINKAKLNPFKDSEDMKNIVVSEGKLRVYSALANANIYENDDNIIIITKNTFSYNMLNQEENLEYLQNILKEKYSISKKIRLEYLESKAGKENKMEKLFEQKNVEYTNLD